MKKEEFYEKMSQIKKSLLQMEDVHSLNELTPLFTCQRKLVIDCGDEIYRIDREIDIKLRGATREYFKSKGYDIFLNETICYDLSCYDIWVSRQQKIVQCDKDFSFPVMDFPGLEGLIKSVGMIWFNGRNCGILEGKPKILDWTANLALRNNSLVGGKGEVLYGI